MATCNFTIQNELALIEKYKLTPNEFFVLRLIIYAQNDNTDELTLQFLSSCPENRTVFKGALHSLQNKRIILQDYKIPEAGERFSSCDVMLNHNVLRTTYKAAFDLGAELFEVYPMFCTINGVTQSIKSVSKKFDSLEEAFMYYGKAINYNPELHNHIIELVKWAVDNTNFINCTFANFIIDRKWEAIDRLRSGEECNINFNTVRML